MRIRWDGDFEHEVLADSREKLRKLDVVLVLFIVVNGNISKGLRNSDVREVPLELRLDCKVYL